MAFRGIDFIAAPTLVCELGDIRRFGHPRELMYYLGLVPGERSSGDRSIRGATTETGKHVPARPLYLVFDRILSFFGIECTGTVVF